MSAASEPGARAPAGMKHHHETEIKLEIENPRGLKRRLADLGFRRVEARHFESNVLFDFPDSRLRKARCLLRLRFIDGETLLTFKGAPLRGRRYKIRRELETRVENGQGLRDVFQNIGLRETFRYEKYRTVYARRGRTKRAGSPVLVFDETPIGNYLELEGPKRWIDLVARQLGYRPEDYIPAGYVTLYLRYCLERGKEPGNMVFRGHKY